MEAGVCSAGFEHHAIAGGQGWRQFPHGHQNREIPRDDLAHDAERLVVVVGIGFRVDLRDGTFLRADAAGEITEMVDGQRNVGIHRFADRLAVVDGFRRGDQAQVLFDAVGDAVQDIGALGRRGLAPGILGGMGGVQRQLDVFRRGTGDFAKWQAGDRRDVGKVFTFYRGDEFAADVIVIALFEGIGYAQFADVCEIHVVLYRVN